MRFDWIVVGAGFAGSVVAERIATVLGQRVLIVDRRSHFGGNAYDEHDEAGILVHRYGPHIFHTNADRVVEYLSQFTQWRPYEHRVLARVRGQLVPMPINLDTINRLYGLSLGENELEDWFAERAEPRAVLRTSEDAVVARVGRELYELFFRGYTRKQWGLDPSQLDASVTSRIPIRTNRDDRYFTDSFQAMPRDGYTAMFERMLDHPNIKVAVDTDFRDVPARFRDAQVVYTGPVDEYFGRRFGALPYRSLDFRFETHDTEWMQPVATVNEPSETDVPYTRVTEFKHLTGQSHSRTTLVYEFPRSDGDPYYPIPRPENAALYERYRALADATPNVHFVGRLATYKYYNMDQVVAQALTTFRKLAEGRAEVA
ncbi:MAG TPA: UDP-galactopyranose mutase [Candidatus Limnocylindrales bacterium]|nr:UDP-galactopyranose mutase [Candidatus Limnocylindrales bacterium]